MPGPLDRPLDLAAVAKRLDELKSSLLTLHRDEVHGLARRLLAEAERSQDEAMVLRSSLELANTVNREGNRVLMHDNAQLRAALARRDAEAEQLARLNMEAADKLSGVRVLRAELERTKAEAEAQGREVERLRGALRKLLTVSLPTDVSGQRFVDDAIEALAHSENIRGS